MSLARTALRMAAVAALRADPVIAALCPDRVFDSRIDKLDAEDPVPVIVVYTEDDKGRPWSVNNGGPPFDHACDLLFEISMRVVAEAVGDDGSSAPVIGMAETDTEAEVTLDLLEERAIDAVTVADTPQSLLIRTAVTRRAVELVSVRFVSADAGSKLALRMVTLSTHLKINQADPRDIATGPFAALPDPLRTVASAQVPGSYSYQICLGLAAKLNPAPTPQPLEGMDLTYQVQQLTAGETPSQTDQDASTPFTESIDLCPSSPPASS
ncbi:hypothetical protein [Beijerinckia sp. L45]|uniref:hypothetical protein n=1 Tax=Beijerinckia sp. L45 TaxID=1641855 RepID=UPI00131E2916|nr:hypothetical protein [Beijerinckia sp. L45]